MTLFQEILGFILLYCVAAVFIRIIFWIVFAEFTDNLKKIAFKFTLKKPSNCIEPIYKLRKNSYKGEDCYYINRYKIIKTSENLYNFVLVLFLWPVFIYTWKYENVDHISLGYYKDISGLNKELFEKKFQELDEVNKKIETKIETKEEINERLIADINKEFEDNYKKLN